MQLIKPRFRKPITGNETFGELVIDDTSYAAFRRRCLELVEQFDETFLVSSILSGILQWLFRMGDTTSVDEVITSNRWAIQHFRHTRETQPEKAATLTKLIADTERRIEHLADDTRDMNMLYNEFCDHVLRQLYIDQSMPRSQRGEGSK